MKNKTTKDLQQLLQSTNKQQFQTIYEHITEYQFHTYLSSLIQQKGKKKSELIQKANLHRTYAYQIFNGSKCPSRDKVLQLAIALQSSLEECNRLLILAGHHPLYVKNRRDAILIFAISQHLTLQRTEEYLEEYRQPFLSQYE